MRSWGISVLQTHIFSSFIDNRAGIFCELSAMQTLCLLCKLFVCYANSSHEVSTFIFYLKNKEKKMDMSSASTPVDTKLYKL